MIEIVQRLLNRVAVMIGRGFIGTANDSGNVQLLQVSLGQNETLDNIPRLAEYGLVSMPPADGNAAAIVVFINGDRANGVAIATGHAPSRMKNLQPGEAALYDDLGQHVYLTRTGIVIDGAGMNMTIQNVGTLNVQGALSVSGDIASTGGNVKDGTGKSLADARLVFNTHTHTDPQGSVTGVPSASM